MKVVVAVDSFKGSLSSLDAGYAIKKGIENVFSDANVCVFPIADGGEGTVDALTRGMHGRIETITVLDPLARPISSSYGIIEATNTAIIEMASAAGVTLLSQCERNPLHTTTYGVGELIRDGISKGCRNFIIGIGGSATNDGGIGMLQALGFGILDKNGNPVSYGAKGLKEIAMITDDNVIPELKDCTFRIACDVTNPLCGTNGCSAIFAPQKGATPEMIAQMDKWLSHFAALVKEIYPHADATLAGTGAAGGLGFAFLSFTNAILESGIQIVLKEIGLEDAVSDADLVITGEGRLDAQTVMGKAPIGVANIAKKYHKPVLAFSGCVTENAKVLNAYGITAFFPILRECVTSEEAMRPDYAAANLTATVEQVMRVAATFPRL